jgi:hypothetical protein
MDKTIGAEAHASVNGKLRSALPDSRDEFGGEPD